MTFSLGCYGYISEGPDSCQLCSLIASPCSSRPRQLRNVPPYRAGGARREDYSSSLRLPTFHDSCFEKLHITRNHDSAEDLSCKRISYAHVSRIGGGPLPLELELELVVGSQSPEFTCHFSPNRFLPSRKRPLAVRSTQSGRIRIDEVHTVAFAYFMQSYRWLRPVISKSQRRLFSYHLGSNAERCAGSEIWKQGSRNNKAV